MINHFDEIDLTSNLSKWRLEKEVDPNCVFISIVSISRVAWPTRPADSISAPIISENRQLI